MGASTRNWMRAPVGLLLIWGTISSLQSWPLCHSYFTDLVGGPRQGYRYLIESNLDWGEDLALAEHWERLNPHARPLFYATTTDRTAALLDLDWRPAENFKKPGWYLVSLQRVIDPMDSCHVLSKEKAVARLGHATAVYHITD